MLSWLRNFKINKKYGLLLIIFLCCIGGGVGYYIYNQNYPSTDDAYVEAHIVNIAAQVSGKVAEVYVSNNQYVRKGQLLFEIERDQYQYHLNQAQASLELQIAQAHKVKQSIKVAEANFKKAEAQLFIVENNSKRTLALVRKKLVSLQAGDEAKGKLLEAKANVLAAQENVEQARKNYQAQFAQLKVTQQSVNLAALNLKYTKIYAPTSGVVSNFYLRPGSMVQANTNLFAIIDTRDWWVEANYKETDLAHIKVGQAAVITVDLYPKHRFKGYVQSISSSSGTTFSLLPPENATGNWVKVTQRFPIKIAIPSSELAKAYPLRVGASATARVDTLSQYQSTYDHAKLPKLKDEVMKGSAL